MHQQDRVRSVELAEKKMLDELEASTGRTYQHSLRLHDEVTNQKTKLDAMESQYVNTKDSLANETTSIAETRRMGQGLCWMYGVIAAEVAVMILLLYVGLS